MGRILWDVIMDAVRWLMHVLFIMAIKQRNCIYVNKKKEKEKDNYQRKLHLHEWAGVFTYIFISIRLEDSYDTLSRHWYRATYRNINNYNKIKIFKTGTFLPFGGEKKKKLEDEKLVLHVILQYIELSYRVLLRIIPM